MTPFNPNMLLGKITEIENYYVRVVTRFGKNPITHFSYKIKPLHCYQLTLDYSKEVSFTSACKQATFQNE